MWLAALSESNPPRLSKPQKALLAFSGSFFVCTWTFGGQSGYTTGLGYALPWVIATLAAISAAFFGLVRKPQKRFDLVIALAVLSMIDFGIMPLSELSVNGISVSGSAVAISLVSYVWYVVCLARSPKKITENRELTLNLETSEEQQSYCLCRFAALTIRDCHVFGPSCRSSPATSAGVLPLRAMCGRMWL